MDFVVYSSYGAEIGRFKTLDEAMQLANREGNCELREEYPEDVRTECSRRAE